MPVIHRCTDPGAVLNYDGEIREAEVPVFVSELLNGQKLCIATSDPDAKLVEFRGEGDEVPAVVIDLATGWAKGVYDPLVVDTLDHATRTPAYVEEEDEESILRLLWARKPSSVKVCKLAHYLAVSERTLIRKLNGLRARGLIWQPEKKKGVTLTAAGLRLTASLPPRTG
jgi:hypothetical protein